MTDGSMTDGSMIDFGRLFLAAISGQFVFQSQSVLVISGRRTPACDEDALAVSQSKSGIVKIASRGFSDWFATMPAMRATTARYAVESQRTTTTLAAGPNVN